MFGQVIPSIKFSSSPGWQGHLQKRHNMMDLMKKLEGEKAAVKNLLLHFIKPKSLVWNKGSYLKLKFKPWIHFLCCKDIIHQFCVK